MINITTFAAPRVASHHLTQLAGSGACVRVVGRLMEVHADTETYVQEFLLQMADGILVKVIDGTVSGIRQLSERTSRSRCNFVARWKFHASWGSKGGRDGCGFISSHCGFELASVSVQS
jgi:hypothetical protein